MRIPCDCGDGVQLPDVFQEHERPDKQYGEAGLDAPVIANTALEALRFNSVGTAEVSRA